MNEDRMILLTKTILKAIWSIAVFISLVVASLISDSSNATSAPPPLVIVPFFVFWLVASIYLAFYWLIDAWKGFRYLIKSRRTIIHGRY